MQSKYIMGKWYNSSWFICELQQIGLKIKLWLECIFIVSIQFCNPNFDTNHMEKQKDEGKHSHLYLYLYLNSNLKWAWP